MATLPSQVLNNSLPMTPEDRDIVVPEEAKSRGRILRGDLISPHVRIPGIVAQFSNLAPNDREGRIYLYPTLEQANTLFNAKPPFKFVASCVRGESVEERWKSEEIWLNSPAQMTSSGLLFLTHCSGTLANLHVTRSSSEHDQKGGSAWFFTNGCFLQHVLSTREQDNEEVKHADKRPAVHIFALLDSATAELKRITMSHRMTSEVETRNIGHVVEVQGFSDVAKMKRDIDGLLILLSFASRERTQAWFWSAQESNAIHSQHWEFGTKIWPPRPDGEEPLVRRNIDECKDFLTKAIQKYIDASNTSFLDSAVFALLNRDLPLEIRILKLFSGLQSALLFATGSQPKVRRSQMRDLFRDFEGKYSISLGDLWPLFDKSNGPALSDIRNAAVHGEVFTENDFMSLSYASENLQWILERILLTALGWDVARSAVSSRGLQNYCAYYWQSQQQTLKL